MKPRRILSLVLLLGLTFVSPMTTRGDVTNEAAIAGLVVPDFAGRTVNVPWSLEHTGAVSGVEFDLIYSANSLIVGAFQPGALSINVAFRTRQIAPGQQRLLFYTTDGSALPTNMFIGDLPTAIPAGNYGGGGHITISNALVSRMNATAASPVALAFGGVISGSVFRGSDGVVDLQITVPSNHLWTVQATTNFANWVNIATNFATLNYIIVTDLDASNFPTRFYRAVLVAPTTGGQISGVTLMAGTQLTFSYATTTGRTYVMQASTNLTNWVPLTTNVAGGSLLNFTNMITPLIPNQFFRVVQLP